MKVLKVLLITIFSSLLLFGCGQSEPSVASAKGNAAGGGPRGGGAPRKVATVLATEKSFDQTALVTGTLAADNEIVLGMKVAGRISELNVDLGSTVRKGDVIARLDPTDFDIRIRQSEAALQQALVRLGLPMEIGRAHV